MFHFDSGLQPRAKALAIVFSRESFCYTRLRCRNQPLFIPKPRNLRGCSLCSPMPASRRGRERSQNEILRYFQRNSNAKSVNPSASLLMNRPTPNPSQAGSRPADARRQFPSWEGLGVGSGAQSANAFRPLTLSPSEGEREQLRLSFLARSVLAPSKTTENPE